MLEILNLFQAFSGASDLIAGGGVIASIAGGFFGRKSKMILLVALVAGLGVAGIWHWSKVRGAYNDGDAAGYARAAAEIQAATERLNSVLRENDAEQERLSAELERVRDERDEIAAEKRRELKADDRSSGAGIPVDLLRDFLD